MATNGTKDWWKTLCMASIAVNITLAGVWVATGNDMVTESEMSRHVETAIKAQVRYPWEVDRAIVMSHLNSQGGIHEDDSAKRARIRQELQSALAPINSEINYLRRSVDELKKQFDLHDKETSSIETFQDVLTMKID